MDSGFLWLRIRLSDSASGYRGCASGYRIPELTVFCTQLELRGHLERIWLDRRPCFRHRYTLDHDFWTIYSAIIVHVKSLNLGPIFEGCPDCHAAYLTVVTGSGFNAETSRASCLEDSVPVENPPSSPPQALAQGGNNIGDPEQATSSAPASPPLQSQYLGSTESGDAEIDPWSLQAASSPPSFPLRSRNLGSVELGDAEMLVAFRSFRDTSLAPAERQQTLDAVISTLVTLASTTGLRLPGVLLPPAAQSEKRPTLSASSSSNIVESGANDEQHPPAQFSEPRGLLCFTEVNQGQQFSAPMTQPGYVTTFNFDSAPNSDLKKRHKIAEIKRILIDMLREINFPLHNNYLPWSTLEVDLQKHGYEITNWPSGVLRENDKGINTLNAEHVQKLYLALTQANDDDRPRFVRRVDRPTDQDEGVTAVRNVASSKRRLAVDHGDGKGKRTRFKVMTAENYAGHSTEG
ncbi:hypothetical protein PAXINDRAFT_16179 [Paxillus involutus ATCC 200175]|uniref:Uncharacterized protein n=1 Tax=Paxillus involutus ATCC 200175 TaxID=664439 RepID=A0A0C9TSQ9_PAXIN|nr:hypothetical protein PAXINDRAFT_16179 [Paxillus involutus ATCC 200175]